jgi:tetrahydromethanopterin S-methyltransferase subunit G
MTDAELQRDIGRLEGKVEGLADAMSEMKDEFKKRLDSVDEKIDGMSVVFQRVGGAWKMLLVVATAFTAIGGLIVKFLPFFQQK